MANRRNIAVSGVRQITESIDKVRANFNTAMSANLNYVGLDAIRHARLNRGYTNRTANLCNSIAYTARINNFQSKTQSIGEVQPEQSNEEGANLSEAIVKGHTLSNVENQRNGIQTQGGVSLTLVAGMEYARYVEDMGYNVLDSSSKKAEKDFEQAIEDVIEDMVKILNGEL